MQTKYWKNPENGRYYVAQPIKDLLGDYTIAVANGGVDVKHKRYRAIYASKVKDNAQEENVIAEIAKTREAHKYIELNQSA